MNHELMNNKVLQALLASLQPENLTDDEPDQPLGRYGKMAMDYLHKTNPQRFAILKMTGELMSMMYRVDEEAWEQIEVITQSCCPLTRCRRRTIY